MRFFILLFQAGCFIFLFLLSQVTSSSLLNTSLSPSPSLSQQLCHQDERIALLEFVSPFSINAIASFLCFSSYPKTETWKKSKDCCAWDGVSCDYANGHVIGLDLACSRLSGKINPNSTLFHLSYLQRLSLAYNDFTSSGVSSHVGRFRDLTHLNLSSSSFAGEVPSEISQLTTLISLDLSLNKLQFPNPIWRDVIHNLTILREFHLDGVNLDNVKPNSLMNLSLSLISLDFSSCNLIGSLPNHIFSLPNLEVLSLSSNSELIINFPKSNLSKTLRALYLFGTNFWGASIPSSIGDFNSLEVLHLSECNITGTIPESIGTLHALTELRLSFNNITGTIPSTFANLKYLVSFYVLEYQLVGLVSNFWSCLTSLIDLIISSNYFTGQLPPSLLNLSFLGYLYALRNKLIGSIPIPNNKPSNLREMDLSSNSFNGTIPSWIYALPSLEILNLSDNQFTDEVGEFQYNSLRYLLLGRNRLQGLIPTSIYKQVNLTLLSVEFNNLSVIINQDMFTQLANLLHLDLSNTTILFSNKSHANYMGSSNLSKLYLSSCKLTEFPYFLYGLHSLQFLDLSDNKIQGNIPNWLESVGRESLSYLNLSYNQLEGTLQVPWKNMQALDVNSNSLRGSLTTHVCEGSSLYFLDLSYNNFNGEIPHCLGNVSSLKILNLQQNSVHGTIPAGFTRDCRLQVLDLNYNKIEGPLPRSLGNCLDLKVLNLGNNKINGSFPSWIGLLPNLQVFVLRSNRFHGPINNPMGKSSFSSLHILDLSHNEFSGSLPLKLFSNLKSMMATDTQGGISYIENIIYVGYQGQYYRSEITLAIKGADFELPRILTSWRVIDLSGNYFTGSIPDSIASLKSLHGLNLSHNNLTGSISPLLGSLRNLQWLDLSSNKLRGKIPEQLTDLTFLEVLNLSENQLSGPIPQGKQFDTFGSDSYEGNIELCGLPLLKKCEDIMIDPPITQDDGLTYGVELSWKVVVAGYASGFVFGISMSYIAFSIGRPYWVIALLKRFQHASLKI